MLRNFAVYAGLVSCFVGSLWGQHAVDPANRYYRVIALVHLTGTGKLGDPIRPEFIPNPAGDTAGAPKTQAIAAATSSSTATLNPRPGIIAWSMQLTDDKTMAIVHLAAVDHHAFDAILSDKRPEVKVFEVGQHPTASIELALKQAKRDFSISAMQVVAQ